MNRIGITLAALAALILAQNPVFADGGADGGGGDIRAIQFVQVAKSMADFSGLARLPINIRQLKKVIAQTKVESTRLPLELKGVPKDAINYPREKHILFNSDRWDSIVDGSRRAALVLHEYLGILGVDDRNYQYSSRFYGDKALALLMDSLGLVALSSEYLNDIPFAVQCDVYDHGQLKGIIGPVGPLVTFPVFEDNQPASSLMVRTSDKGELTALVDTGVRPFSGSGNLYSAGRTKKPLVRILIGYGSLAVGFEGKALATADVRVGLDFDATVTAAEEQVEVHCKRAPR